jgi:hypothetical protein
MKKTLTLGIILALVMWQLPLSISGQVTDCYKEYEKALVNYNSGMSDATLSTLKPCLENKESLSKESKETRARIYRLAALSSIMIGDAAQAEEYIRQMLINQPDYKSNPNPDDLMEFKQILEKVEVKPSFMIGIMGGMNYPFIKLQKQYSNYDLTDGNYKFNSSFGYQFEIFAEKAITKNFSIEAAAVILRNNFAYELAGQYPSTSEVLLYQYNQEVNWIEIPVLAKYYFNTGSLRPYLEAGISTRFLINQVEKSDTYGKYWFTNSSNSDNILTTFSSDLNYIGINLGAGAAWNLSKFSLRFDIRYSHYFNNSVVVSNFDDITGYQDISSSEKFYYTDDINLINLKYLQISVGLIYSIKYKVF